MFKCAALQTCCWKRNSLQVVITGKSGGFPLTCRQHFGNIQALKRTYIDELQRRKLAQKYTKQPQKIQ